MIWILILNHLYLGDLILILKSSRYDDFAHLCIVTMNESPLIISNTFIIPPNSIALTIAFIKKKTKLSYTDLKKKR